ncbi:MAG: hypothetical protein CMJ58_21150 [Planctomycetaceae bacterium]|nr:hypothetical protein [Planctomycetaceae bacterium]
MTNRPLWCYRLALVCGAVPLLAGLAILAAFAATEWDGFVVAGLICFYAGAVCFVIGGIALAVRAYLLRDQSERKFRWLPGGLLLLCWPAAVFCLFCGLKIISKYAVIVQNDSPHVLTAVELIGGGCDGAIGDVPAGETRRINLWFHCDDELRMRFKRQGEEHSVLVDSYVTANLGGKKRLVVRLDGGVDVQDHAGDSRPEANR